MPIELSDYLKYNTFQWYKYAIRELNNRGIVYIPTNERLDMHYVKACLKNIESKGYSKVAFIDYIAWVATNIKSYKITSFKFLLTIFSAYFGKIKKEEKVQSKAAMYKLSAEEKIEKHKKITKAKNKILNCLKAQGGI